MSVALPELAAAKPAAEAIRAVVEVAALVVIYRRYRVHGLAFPLGQYCVAARPLPGNFR